MKNAFVESFNRRFRDELLSETPFSSLTQARDAINSSKEDYNNDRPHSALGNLTPSAFAAQLEPARKVA